MKKYNFEESLKRLEEITDKLESDDLTLDESLKLFEEGVSLSRYCEKKLTEAEQKIEILKSSEIEEFSDKNIDQIEKFRRKKKSLGITTDDEVNEERNIKNKKDSFLF